MGDYPDVHNSPSYSCDRSLTGERSEKNNGEDIQCQTSISGLVPTNT